MWPDGAMTDQITLVMTSCGRLNLLQRTLRSFLKFNTYPIAKGIIIEDSGRLDLNASLDIEFPFPVTIIQNQTNLGQIKSIDIAYSHVKTSYIFHCEDDWEFFKGGFIEASLDILKQDPKVICVWLRAYNDTMGHKIERLPHGRYDYMALNFDRFWHGFTFNPGLRPTRDCMRLHPFSDLEVLVKKKPMAIGEADLSGYYKMLGYRAAITDDEAGYVRHIGHQNHIDLPWERNKLLRSKHKEPIKKVLRLVGWL
jgi:GT2 family glycosyltransferase